MKEQSKPEQSATGVPSRVYSREYFLTECDGHQDFADGRVPRRLDTALRLAGQLQNKTVLDVGSGRGEVVLYCAKAGAKACGIDYSAAALQLAQAAATASRRCLPPASVPPSVGQGPSEESAQRPRSAAEGTVGDGRPTAELAHFQRADAQHLPFRDRSFDVVFMLDIVEHLYPEQLQRTFREVHRTLRANGLLVVHTMPNLWYYRVGYPLYRWVQRLRGHELPRDPRQRWQFVPTVHVNEQDIWRLSHSLRSAGFSARVWLQPTQTYAEEKNAVVRSLMRILASCYPFRWVFCDDIFALARKLR